MRIRNISNKKLFGFIILAIFAMSFGAMNVYALKMTSSSFIIQDPIVGTGGGYGSSASFKLFTSGNETLSGYGTSASFKGAYGFLYFTNPSSGTITFDIDTATTDTESSSLYSVALGTLTTSSVARSNGSINSIWIDLDTNSTSGAVVTVKSSNASLKSTSVPADTIPSATGTMAAGTANYGLCVASATAGTGTFTKVSPYNGATCVDGASNTVGLLDGTAQNILNSNNAPIITGRAQIRVNAAISNVTPAHVDYTDSLTFIATSTF